MPFSVLNQRLKPQFTAMERLCYSLSTLEDRPHTPGLVRGRTNTQPTILTPEPEPEPEPQANESLSTTGLKEEPEQDDVDTDGFKSQDKEHSSAESVAVVSDSMLPCLTINSLEPADPDDSTAVTEPSVSSVPVEGDAPGGLTLVGDGDGSDPGEAVPDGEGPDQRSFLERALPDLISSGRPIGRRRTLGPVSDTLKEVRREVELSRKRSLRLKAQVDKLQENRDGSGWGQQRERVTEEVKSVLRLLLPLTKTESIPAEPSGLGNQLDSALITLNRVARKLAVNHMAQDSKHGVRNSRSAEDSAVLQQALRDRDEALEKKRAMEEELLRSKTEMMLLNNQLLEAAQKRLELSLELEAWKEDIQIIIQHQIQSQQLLEQEQKKTTRLGLMRRTNKPPIQRPATISFSKPTQTTPASAIFSKPTPTATVSPPSPKPVPVATPPAPPQSPWRKMLRRGKADRHSNRDAGPECPHSEGSREEGFHNVALD